MIFALRSLCVSDDDCDNNLDNHMLLCNAKARIIIIIIIIIMIISVTGLLNFCLFFLAIMKYNISQN